MVEFALVVVEAQKKGADQGFAFEVAEAADDAIGGAFPFDLLHASALSGLVGQVAALGDDAVESDSHVKPLFRDGEIFGDGREADRVVAGEIFFGELLEFLAALLKGKIDKGFAAIVYQEIEDDEGRRSGFAKLFDAAGGGMNPHQEGVEGELPALRDDDFAVQDELFGGEGGEVGGQFGEIAG